MRRLGDDLRAFWERFRGCFRTRTRDTSEHALWYWRGQLTMEDGRNFANIERRLHGGLLIVDESSDETAGESVKYWVNESTGFHLIRYHANGVRVANPPHELKCTFAQNGFAD